MAQDVPTGQGVLESGSGVDLKAGDCGFADDPTAQISWPAESLHSPNGPRVEKRSGGPQIPIIYNTTRGLFTAREDGGAVG